MRKIGSLFFLLLLLCNMQMRADRKKDSLLHDIDLIENTDVIDKGLLNSIIDVLGGALSVAEDVAYTLLTPVQKLIKQHLPAIVKNEYSDITAHVRNGEPISYLESEFRRKRTAKVKKAQEKMLGMHLEDDDVLDIAFSCSGGGWRAMCCSLGSCVGAKKIGLLDCIMCMSGLSGSTWFIGPWISSGLPIEEYKERALNVASKGLDLRNTSDVPHMVNNIWAKFAYNQPLNMVDLYGSLLGNSLLRDLKYPPERIYLSDQHETIAYGDFPFPVYTATLGERGKAEFWFEFTPYEVGSRWLSSYVPTWGFGRHFKKGISISDAPEQSLGFLLGTFGSAFAADFEDAYDIVLNGIQFPKFLRNIPFAETVFNSIKKVFTKLAYASDFGDLRVAWARVPNFVYDLKGVPHSGYKDLKLVDAGLDFNNPVFATYRKPPFGDAPDIVFIFDSGGSVSFEELQRVVDYAKYNGLKFPNVKYFDVGKQVMAAFKDEHDVDVPVVVYMPRINGISLVQKKQYKAWYDYYVNLLEGFDIEKAIDSGFASTFNFNYSKREAEQLVAMTEFNVLLVADLIKDVMRDRIDQKRKHKAQ